MKGTFISRSAIVFSVIILIFITFLEVRASEVQIRNITIWYDMCETEFVDPVFTDQEKVLTSVGNNSSQLIPISDFEMVFAADGTIGMNGDMPFPAGGQFDWIKIRITTTGNIGGQRNSGILYGAVNGKHFYREAEFAENIHNIRMWRNQEGIDIQGLDLCPGLTENPAVTPTPERDPDAMIHIYLPVVMQ